MSLSGSEATPSGTPAGSLPQHLLLTLFGDYWMGHDVSLPSSGLVALLQEFGFSEASARVTLNRMARRGVLSLTKKGRQTSYRVVPEILEGGIDSRPRLLSFGTPGDAAEQWDGTWILLTFSIPLEHNRLRRPFRARLRALGFAPLQDSVWVTAATKKQDATAMLADFPGIDAFIIHGSVAHPVVKGALNAVAAWPIDDIRQDYEQFIERYAPHRQRALTGRISPAEALVLRTEIMDQWRGLFRNDPNLPRALLPADWPRPEAREILMHIYDALGPLAEQRCQQILDRHASGHIPPARHYTIADYLTTSAREHT